MNFDRYPYTDLGLQDFGINAAGKKNLAEETAHFIAVAGYSPNDIVFIGSVESGRECSWTDYLEIADLDYRPFDETEHIARDLVIIFQDQAQMYRSIYDGYEWWQIAPSPKTLQRLTPMRTSEAWSARWRPSMWDKKGTTDKVIRSLEGHITEMGQAVSSIDYIGLLGKVGNWSDAADLTGEWCTWDELRDEILTGKRFGNEYPREASKNLIITFRDGSQLVSEETEGDIFWNALPMFKRDAPKRQLRTVLQPRWNDYSAHLISRSAQPD